MSLTRRVFLQRLAQIGGLLRRIFSDARPWSDSKF